MTLEHIVNSEGNKSLIISLDVLVSKVRADNDLETEGQMLYCFHESAHNVKHRMQFGLIIGIKENIISIQYSH